MPNRTLTINNADGSSETYTINRDKFEGVREMTRGHVYPTIFESSYSGNGVTYTKANERTFSIEASNSSADKFVLFAKTENEVRTGKHRITFDANVASGSISTILGYYTDADSDPAGDPYTFFNLVEGSNVFDIELFDDGVSVEPRIGLMIQTGSTFDLSVTNFKITHEPDTVAVDHTPPPDVRTLTVNDSPLTIDTTAPADIRSVTIDGESITINRGESNASLTITNATDPNYITNQLQFNGDTLTFNNQPLTYNG